MTGGLTIWVRGDIPGLNRPHGSENGQCPGHRFLSWWHIRRVVGVSHRSLEGRDSGCPLDLPDAAWPSVMDGTGSGPRRKVVANIAVSMDGFTSDRDGGMGWLVEYAVHEQTRAVFEGIWRGASTGAVGPDEL